MSKPTEIAGLSPAALAREVAPEVVLARLADVRAVEPKARRILSARRVHDLRVALRRLRAALQLFGAPRSLDRAAKQTQDALGQVRDRQMRIRWLAGLELTGIDAVVHGEQAALANAWAPLHEALATWREHTSAEVARVAPALRPKGKLAGGRARRLVRERLARLEHALPEVLAGAPPPAAHRMRIQLKKLRYEAEVAAMAAPEVFGPVVETAAPLQSLLGDLHDADVREGWALGRAVQAANDQVPVLLAIAERARQEREQLAAKTLARLATLQTEDPFGRLARLVRG